MKLKFLSLSLIVPALLASCNLNNDDDSNYQKFTYSTCNLVIPADGNAFPSNDAYVLYYYPYSSTVTVSSTALSLGVGSAPFTTANMHYDVAAYGDAGAVYTVTKFSGGSALDGNVSISNLSGFTSEIVNTVPSHISEYPFVWNPAIVMQYTANYDYTVKTFSTDAVYNGLTSLTTLNSENPPYDNDQGLYRVVFHTDLKKADVIFYNAKFADRMPSQTFIVKDLEVVYTKNSYMIRMPEGSDGIVPLRQEGQGGQFTPYPSYVFTQFQLAPSTSDLTGVMINYSIDNSYDGKVVAQYRGTFNGFYTYSGPTASN